MAGRYRPYSSYNHTGIEWLGDIPNGWGVLQSRRMFAQRKERAQPDDEQLTSSQKYGIIYQKKFMELENLRVVQVITGSEILKHVEANDFVISMRSFQGGLEWCKYPGCVSSAYIGLIPQKHVIPVFFSYLFKSKQYIQALQSTSNLVRDGQALRFENFSQVPLPIIPEEEQIQIAAFLDHETAQIDALIVKQQRLIALLEEKRQAVISHAVTKGLNASAPLRPSGIDGLGDVPEHWEVKRLKYIATIQSGIPKGPTLESDALISVPMLRVANVQDGYLNLDNVHEIRILRSQLERFSLQVGDVLMNEGGDNDKLGRGAVWEGQITPCIHQNHVFAIRTHFPDSNWLSVVTQASYAKFSFFRVAKQSTNLASISSTNIKETPVVFPPRSEREDILKFVALQKSRYDGLNDNCQKQITLLKERRTALISAAVTGKIDVRDWQPPKSLSDSTPDISKDAFA